MTPKPGDVILHPVTGDTVVVERISERKGHIKVYFKGKGQNGWFKTVTACKA